MLKTIYSPAYRSLITELKQARIKRKMRQEDAGKLLGVTRHWIQKVETCQIRLDVIGFVSLCRIYRANPSRLISRLEEKASEEDPSFYVLAMVIMWKKARQYDPFSVHFLRTVDSRLAKMQNANGGSAFYSSLKVVFCPHFALLSVFEHPKDIGANCCRSCK